MAVQFIDTSVLLYAISHDPAEQDWTVPASVDSALATWAELAAQPEPVTQTVEEITGVPA